MCIIIDINVLHCVFQSTKSNHSDFLPVKKWIMKKGYIIYGGTAYKNELKSTQKCMSILVELYNMGRIKRIDDQAVDKEQKIVDRLLDGKDCDDSHIIAIVRASGCRILCSNDSRSDKYIKDSSLYTNGQQPPAIYRSRKHIRLLSKNNIVNLTNQSPF